jgi:hypothetical protein
VAKAGFGHGYSRLVLAALVENTQGRHRLAAEAAEAAEAASLPVLVSLHEQEDLVEADQAGRAVLSLLLQPVAQARWTHFHGWAPSHYLTRQVVVAGRGY